MKNEHKIFENCNQLISGIDIDIDIWYLNEFLQDLIGKK